MKKEARNRLERKINDHCKVDKINSFKISDHDTDWRNMEDLKKLGERSLKKKAKKMIDDNLKELSEAQELLYASNKYSMLLVFQAMDAAGKDGTIKHVMSGVNPQGCEVHSFKKPSAEESAHNYLWRYTTKMPVKGQIGIFNRSYYEEVLVLKVNPELVHDAEPDEGYWEGRYEDINDLEKYLNKNGTIVLKFFLNVSKDEQKTRFLERTNSPEKHWKFSDSDLVERAKWNSYQKAFEDAINATATEHTPWWVIPADNKWIMRTIVSTIVTDTITRLKLEAPKVSEEKKKMIDAARAELEAE